jgi:hypothetical protein
MNEELHTGSTTPLEMADDTGRTYPIGVNPDAPPHARDAAIAYRMELDELLAHLAAHPAERWVAYRGSRRIGFGTDHLALHRECQEKFPDGLFRIYGIDGADKCPEDTVV